MKRALLLTVLICTFMLTPLQAGPLQRLDTALRAAGIPIYGVSATGTTRSSVTILYRPEATQQNQSDGATLLATFDFTPKARPTRQQIIDKIATLTAAQKTALFTALFSDLAINDPSLLTEAGYDAD